MLDKVDRSELRYIFPLNKRIHLKRRVTRDAQSKERRSIGSPRKRREEEEEEELSCTWHWLDSSANDEEREDEQKEKKRHRIDW